MALALGSLDDEDGVVVVVAAVELACLGVATSDGSVILFDFLLDLGDLRSFSMSFVLSFGVKVCGSAGSKKVAVGGGLHLVDGGGLYVFVDYSPVEVDCRIVLISFSWHCCSNSFPCMCIIWYGNDVSMIITNKSWRLRAIVACRIYQVISCIENAIIPCWGSGWWSSASRKVLTIIHHARPVVAMNIIIAL